MLSINWEIHSFLLFGWFHSFLLFEWLLWRLVAIHSIDSAYTFCQSIADSWSSLSGWLRKGFPTLTQRVKRFLIVLLPLLLRLRPGEQLCKRRTRTPRCLCKWCRHSSKSSKSGCSWEPRPRQFVQPTSLCYTQPVPGKPTKGIQLLCGPSRCWRLDNRHQKALWMQ